MNLNLVQRLTNISHAKTPNQKMSWFLVHCFLYYVADQPILSDSDFNQLAQELKECWDQVDHRHKHLVSIEDLQASTGYAIQYPLSIEGAAYQVLRDYRQALVMPEPKPVLTRVKAKIKML